MRKASLAGIAVVAILAGAGLVVVRDDAASAEKATEKSADKKGAPAKAADGDGGKTAPSPATADARKVLYWRHPDKADDFSPTARKTPDGRAYLPVYDEQEADFKEVTAAKQKAQQNKGRKLLYYRNPMGLPDTSPVPKKDWMGMDYIPVYEGEDDAGSSVSISLDRVQRSGVRTEKAAMRVIERRVRAPGIAKPDERSLRVVSLRSDGFIEKLYVNETGRHVKAGEPLFRVYSPQVVSAQVDYRNTASFGRGERDEQAAVQRLRNLDVPAAVIDQLRRGSGPILAFDWPAPVSGYVMDKNVTEGQMAKAGEALFRIAGLDPVWVICDVPEQDIAMLREGAEANVGFRAFPERLFKGRVTFILHELDAKTRTAKVRVELPNADHAIRHEMFADVEIAVEGSETPRLAVPVSAVIDTGARQVVLVERGAGKFEPRNVKLGVRGDGLVEVTDGIGNGDSVVVSANFLIDAESNIRSALKAFTADAKSGAEAPQPVSPAASPGVPSAGKNATRNPAQAGQAVHNHGKGH